MTYTLLEQHLSPDFLTADELRPLSYEIAARAFYRRLAAAFPASEDRFAFEVQVDRAEIVPVDNEHDSFRLERDVPDVEVSNASRVVEATYSDADGCGVNVLVHFVGARINWAERFRDMGDPIKTWPPNEGVPLKFPKRRE